MHKQGVKVQSRMFETMPFRIIQYYVNSLSNIVLYSESMPGYIIILHLGQSKGH